MGLRIDHQAGQRVAGFVAHRRGRLRRDPRRGLRGLRRRDLAEEVGDDAGPAVAPVATAAVVARRLQRGVKGAVDLARGHDDVRARQVRQLGRCGRHVRLHVLAAASERTRGDSRPVEPQALLRPQGRAIAALHGD